MAKKKRKKAAKKRRTREWIKVTFETLDGWRAARNIPKKKMAEMLGVTNSTYHNWARGVAVATPNTQDRILRVIGGSGHASHADTGDPNAGPEVMAATGQIVKSYLDTRPTGMTVDKLVKLVRDVRTALTV